MKKTKSLLNSEAQELFTKIQAEYSIFDDTGIFLLTSAMESFTMMRQAQEDILRDGLHIRDRWAQIKVHPGAVVVRDAKSSMNQSLKMLNLDISIVESKGPGRPGGVL